MKLHLGVFKEVFLDKVYRVDIDNPKIIFDLGAHVGYSAIYFALRYPFATIHAFEPDPRAFKTLRRWSFIFRNITPHEVAVSDSDGQADLYCTPDSLGSSALTEKGAVVSVPTRSLTSLVKQLGTPDIIKFNVEGAETTIFKDFDVSVVRRYVGEYHEDLTGIPVDTFLSPFARKEYTRILRKKPRYYCRMTGK